MDNMNTAIILAGGKSARMGFDKQFLRLQDRLLMDMLIEKLKELFDEIIIVTNKPAEYEKYDCTIAQDQIKDLGPMGGLHAGLKASNSKYNYMIACDMPCINAEFIFYMKKLIEACEEAPEAVVARLGQWIEPFNAFYSKALIAKIEQGAGLGRKKINELVHSSKALYIEECKAREFSPLWEMFTNINSEEDLENVKLLMEFTAQRYGK